MTESLTLQAQCEKCGHTWLPFGRFTQMRVPHFANITCPECKNQQQNTWLDSESQTKLAQKQLNLGEDKSGKILELEHKIQLLEKELELEKKKRELFEVRLEQFSVWADEREQDFQFIENLANELHDDENFRNNNK